MDAQATWRQQESWQLARTVQQRFSQLQVSDALVEMLARSRYLGIVPVLQNPHSCADARKVVCNLNKGCGYGCQLHHVAYCMIVAYGTNRTLVLESHGWRCIIAHSFQHYIL